MERSPRGRGGGPPELLAPATGFAAEIRDYPLTIVAEVEVAGERKAAINAGFRLLANYIFGNNSPTQKIPTTAPFTQQAGEKIAMTAPVSQQAAGGSWKVRFVMPSSYTTSRDTTPAETKQPFGKTCPSSG